MSFFVQFLGTGSALPTNKQNPTSQYLFCENRHFLIDCGEGTQIQLRKRGIKIQKIDAIFISHLHGDHYFGLVGLLSSMHLLGRKKKIVIYSHAELKEIVHSQLFIGGAKLTFEIEFKTIEANYEGEIYSDKIISIKTFKLKHKINTHGFCFEEKPKPRHLLGDKFKESGLSIAHIPKLKAGKDVKDENGKIISYLDYTNEPEKSYSYAFCSDTAYSENILQHIQNVDVLYHEATFIQKEEERAHKTKHSTAKEAATIACKANVGKLYMGHMSARYNNSKQHLKEANAIFENSFMAIEGEVVKLN